VCRERFVVDMHALLPATMCVFLCLPTTQAGLPTIGEEEFKGAGEEECKGAGADESKGEAGDESKGDGADESKGGGADESKSGAAADASTSAVESKQEQAETPPGAEGETAPASVLTDEAAKAQALRLKEEGNKYWRLGLAAKAEECYLRGIGADPRNVALYG